MTRNGKITRLPRGIRERRRSQNLRNERVGSCRTCFQARCQTDVDIRSTVAKPVLRRSQQIDPWEAQAAEASSWVLSGTTQLQSMDGTTHLGPFPSPARGEGNRSRLPSHVPNGLPAHQAKNLPLSPRRRGEGLRPLHRSGSRPSGSTRFGQTPVKPWSKSVKASQSQSK